MSTPTVITDGFAEVAQKTWPVVLVRGILAVILAIVAFVAPLTTAVTFAVVIGAFTLVDGVIDIIHGVRHRGTERTVQLVLGALGVIFGLVVLIWPGKTLALVAILIGLWALLIGILQIVGAVAARKVPGSNWVLSLVGGVLAVIFGIAVLLSPGAGLITVVWIVAFWALLFGILFIVLALRLRSAGRTPA